MTEFRSRLFTALPAVVLVLAAVLSWTTDAHAWWNEKWPFRQKIVLDTSATGADIVGELAEFPVLIRLHAGNFDFAKARPGGEDLRLVSSDDKTPLEFHVESWDTVEGMAYIWVRMPRLASVNNQQHVFLYYGNKDAPAVGEVGKTFESGHVLVYHLGEAQGPPQDATAFGNNAMAFALGQGTPSVVGKGAAFSGAGDHITVGAHPSLDFSKGFTASAWVRLAQAPTDAVIFALGDAEPFTLAVTPAGMVLRLALKDGRIFTSSPVALAVGQWHHVAATLSNESKVALYLDGQPTVEATLPGPVVAAKGQISIGASAQNGGGRYLAAELDEAQVSTLARPAAWFKAQFQSQGSEARLVSFGGEELGHQPSVFEKYMVWISIVMENITLDGWMIIFFLAIMEVLVLVVFTTKALALTKNDSANQDFFEAFEGLDASILALKSQDGEYHGATLFNVYLTGCEEVETQLRKNGLTEDGKPKIALGALQKAMEVAFVRESRRLNAWLMLMTLSVAGGPFLGLLGTVWGVMITFAALTLAGEASLAAIAPGMASALSTTVVGLVVAIPALFGYNFLIAKVKDITADMSVFIDRFIQKVEEGSI